jgi:hypothetical protein
MAISVISRIILPDGCVLCLSAVLSFLRGVCDILFALGLHVVTWQNIIRAKEASFDTSL